MLNSDSQPCICEVYVGQKYDFQCLLFKYTNGTWLLWKEQEVLRPKVMGWNWWRSLCAVSEPNWKLKYSSYKQTDLSLCLSLFIWTKDRRVLLSSLTRGRKGSQCDLFPLPNPFFNNTTWVKTTNLLSLKSRWDDGWHGGFPPNINPD